MHSPPYRTSIALLCAASSVLMATKAGAFQCQRRPAVELAQRGSAVPLMPHLYLQEELEDDVVKRLRLVNTERKEKIRLRQLKDPARLVPKRALSAGVRYLLMDGEKRVARFIALDESHPRAALSYAIEFSKAHVQDPNTPSKVARYTGRSAYVTSKARREERPAILVVKARFTERGKGASEPFTIETSVGYSKRALFALNAPCSPMSTPAPNRGTYEVSVTPWWPDGHKGETKSLKGVIR